jgi:hypothetical protein
MRNSYKLILKRIDGTIMERELATWFEAEGIVFATPYEWFKLYRDGVLVSNKEYNGRL